MYLHIRYICLKYIPGARKYGKRYREIHPVWISSCILASAREVGWIGITMLYQDDDIIW